MANRIAGASFVLDGERFTLDANEPPHHLHGGARGLGTRLWDMTPDGARAVRFAHVSPDGAMGYPGRVAFEVTVRLDGSCLRYDFTAQADRPTPVNLTQHNYYNPTEATWKYSLCSPQIRRIIPTVEASSHRLRTE